MFTFKQDAQPRSRGEFCHVRFANAEHYPKPSLFPALF